MSAIIYHQCRTDMYKTISAALFAVALVCAYFVYHAIMGPVRFDKQRDERYKAAVAKLIRIRDAELAYKTINGQYTGDFQALFQFLDTAAFVLTSRRDTAFQVYDKVYRIDRQVDSVIVDTLGFQSVKDSLFSDYDYRQLEIVPFTQGAKFELKADSLEKNAMLNPVFYARVNKRVLLIGLDAQRIEEDIIAPTVAVQGTYLQVGDLKKVTTSGNWPKNLEPDYRASADQP
ncbi:MAG: hypothetical protein V6Z82_02225 [Flavobacteriales bacterium]